MPRSCPGRTPWWTRRKSCRTPWSACSQGGLKLPPRGGGAARSCHHARNMSLPRILGGAIAAALLIAPAAHADVLDSHDGVHIAAHDGTVLWNRYEQGHYGLVRADGKPVDIRTS